MLPVVQSNFVGGGTSIVHRLLTLTAPGTRLRTKFDEAFRDSAQVVRDT